MKSIGGYFELQLPKGVEYYPNLIKLNTARNSFEFILKAKGYSLVYFPYFTCEVMLEPLNKLGIPYQFYTIDDQLNPVLDFDVGPTECLLYTNYFGLKQDTVEYLSKRFTNLIIDNSQAFFSPPLHAIDTFYSCRKFFGVSDGAYLHTADLFKSKLEKDVSLNRFSHLIKSIDISQESAYQDFVKNDQNLINNPIKRMSSLTHQILSGVDYKECKYRRNANFMYLHDFLSKYNDLQIDTAMINSPMVYPFLHSSSKIRDKLIENKIYTATYWPNVFQWTTKKMWENYLSAHLIPLPIDHRYNHSDMKRVISNLKHLI